MKIIKLILLFTLMIYADNNSTVYEIDTQLKVINDLGEVINGLLANHSNHIEHILILFGAILTTVITFLSIVGF